MLSPCKYSRPHAPGWAGWAIQAETWFPHMNAKFLLIYFMPWRKHYHDPQVGNYLQWSPHHSVKNACLMSAPSVAQHLPCLAQQQLPCCHVHSVFCCLAVPRQMPASGSPMSRPVSDPCSRCPSRSTR
jgi:hypothetical protein